jgi:hypothetical protein
MDDNEAIDQEVLSVDKAIWELVNRAWPSLVDTYERLKAIDPILAEKYRLQKETRDAVMEIKRMKLEERAERAKTKEGVKRGVMQIIKAFFGD